MISDWLSFWDQPNSIYVNARHKDVHYRLIARDMAREIAAAAAPRPCVLDYGSGEALHAEVVAAACGELLLCDGAPSIRAGVAGRFAGNPKIRALTPQDVEELPDRCLDFIVLHSVAQYLPPAQLGALLALFRRLLRAGGTLLVSDVIPPQVAASSSAAALLRFGAGNGFLLAALAGLARTVFSAYWRLRVRLGITRYSEAAMTECLAAAGFCAKRAAKNIGHDQTRMAFIARLR